VKYYKIALPLKLQQLYTYSSNSVLSMGCRVLINFRNQIYTGIVWEEDIDLDQKLRIKPILEIIDQNSLIRNDLLQVALWISRYYSTSLGITLSAMLPAAFNIQVQLQVRKICSEFDKELKEESQQILNALKLNVWTKISNLKSKVRSAIYSQLEDLEDRKLIEIKRVYDNKIKLKTVNYVILNEVNIQPELTTKQSDAFNLIKLKGEDIPLAEIARSCSYSIVKNLIKKGLIRIEPRQVRAESQLARLPQLSSREITLTTEQQDAVNLVNKSLTQLQYAVFLIFGITGSGKTEVYLEAIKHTLKQGKTALMLVPEIALTPQMVSRFYSVFGDEIAVLHSHLNDRERWQQWRDISKKRKRIVIGARSAIFAPLENIGIIIVDEEHVNSYKQESNPRYNARDMAILRAKLNDAVCLLGSATPSLESWQNALTDKFQMIKLKNRPFSIELPEVRIIDLRIRKLTYPNFSDEMLTAIEKRLENKEQVLLLHNRRGYSSFVQCVSCGDLAECPQCDISLNYHSATEELKCHYCGYSRKMPRKCDKCGSYVFNFGAPGTQQLEKQLKMIFPTARILRMDSDTARKKDSYDSMFDRMRKGAVDILLGTQMIAKGLDFENVTLVGVILADIGLNIPDFRAGEGTFQLLTQVAGRSGRGNKSGEVMIQTFNPEHYAIAKALDQDYVSFADKELSLREKLFYPPFRKLVRILFSSSQEDFLKKEIRKIHKLRNELQTLYSQEQLVLLGPVEAPFVKLHKKYRHHLIMKSNSTKVLSEVINYIRVNNKLSSKIVLTIDVDPVSLL